MANQKDKYGYPMKKRKHPCNCHGHHINDGKRISWMRRWMLVHVGWDPAISRREIEQHVTLAGLYDGKHPILSDPSWRTPGNIIPTWYDNLWRKEMSLLRRERIRTARYYAMLERRLVAREWSGVAS